ISSFRAVAEGISVDGMPGRTEKTFFTQLPFAMKTKAPVEVATGDRVCIPLTLKNNTDEPLEGALKIAAPGAFEVLNQINEYQTIPAGETKIVYLDYKILNKPGKEKLRILFASRGLKDAFEQAIDVVPQGFPVLASFSGNDREKEYEVSLSNVVDGSISVEFTAFPNVVSDLMKGVESIFREPYGCFEQTSMTSYPNVMALEYLKSTDNNDRKLIARAENLLDKGYNRLVTFETSEKGYEWFGGAPGHEALTAYGLMQFNDMQDVYDKVDKKMIDRTAEWLLSKRDGKGGFKRNDRALDSYGRAKKEITDAYITYALTEAGYDGLEKEVDKAYENALKSDDPYVLALVANTLWMLKDGRALKTTEKLFSHQKNDGSLTGKEHSITYSTGQSLSIETTSLAVLAQIRSGKADQKALTKAVEFLVSSRSGYGSFGNTQGTILALKALTEYARYSKKTDEAGTIEFWVDGKKVAVTSYEAGEKEPVIISGLEKFVGEGKHTMKIKYVGVENPLPYSLAVSWNTYLPDSREECKVDLKTTISARNIKVGETVRLTAKISNKTGDGLPSTVAIVGIPAGLSAQPWQLKEMQEKKVFDYYEVAGNNIVLYYRQMTPSEIKTINFDLKAEIPGEYDAPASSAYLYYTNEYKDWEGLDRIIIGT
ncbi:MAG: hypothetical protein KJ607_12540, partial [Bacteroidetes bacterium]|nr:hypothetical protein [Bacteroidota bacterium]